MSGVKLDWSSAEVRDGKLEVGLQGELPRGWKGSFERTAALLGPGHWGTVKLKKDRVRVGDVVEGEESRLHHFLESVVLQANSAHESPEYEADEDRGADEDEPDGLDGEMTKRFRSFARDPED
jgi:hypothetical protein